MKNKVNWKMVIIGSVICLLPCILGIVMWNDLPERMPIHWNLGGEVDNYTSKGIAVFAFPALMAAFNLLLHFLSSFEKKRENYSKALTTMTYWLIPVISIIAVPMSILGGMGIDTKIQIIIPALAGLMLVFVGNYLPKCKQNSTMGIKIPWTLKSEENWNKTHHMAGFLWIVCGVLVIISAFIKGGLWLMLVIIFIAVIVPTVYSFVLHKRGV